MHYTIYHNPHCSKSCAALSLLQAQNASVEIIDYLQHTPTLEQLTELVNKLSCSPRDLLRQKEAPFQLLGLGDLSKTDNEILQAICAHPILLERPIVTDGIRAIIARPPESLIAWLN